MSVTDAQRAFECGKRTAVDYYSMCREVTEMVMSNEIPDRPLCGPAMEVQEAHLSVYCSLQMLPSQSSFASTAKLFHMQSSTLTINIMNTVKQTGTIDCGFFAIAYADRLATDRYLCTFTFDQKDMRQHLTSGIQARGLISS
jgi:hypothetical protein